MAVGDRSRTVVGKRMAVFKGSLPRDPLILLKFGGQQPREWWVSWRKTIKQNGLHGPMDCYNGEPL